ncbi:hypothetical protein J2W15_004355 [Pseudarthrobacter sulfonivorans]|nr:hypothetical protein [Pseudarthrobacter sulfonivorans]
MPDDGQQIGTNGHRVSDHGTFASALTPFYEKLLEATVRVCRGYGSSELG